jgi:hypothetical protein
MRFEFNQGVPEGCKKWLNENVGKGYNAHELASLDSDDSWFYERIEQEIKSSDPSLDSNVRYVPTITIKDEKKAILFALRWS